MFRPRTSSHTVILHHLSTDRAGGRCVSCRVPDTHALPLPPSSLTLTLMSSITRYCDKDPKDAQRRITFHQHHLSPFTRAPVPCEGPAPHLHPRTQTPTSHFMTYRGKKILIMKRKKYANLS